MCSTEIRTNSRDIPQKFVELWQNLIDIIAKVFNVPAGLIMRVHPPTIEVFLKSNTIGNPYKKGERADLHGLYCNTVMRTQKMLLIPDARKDPHWAHNPDIKLGMVSYLGFPIIWPNREIFGTICVLDNKENAYSEIYVDLLRQFKKMIESHLELILLNQELSDKNLKLETAKLEIHTLTKLLPICIKCKKIRNDSGYWTEVEEYFRQHSDLNFSHGYCNKCFRETYPEYADKVLNDVEKERN